MRRWSVERYLFDQEILQNLIDRYLAIELWEKTRNPLTGDECAELRAMVAELRHPRAIEELCALGATHPSAGIRRALVAAIEPFLATHPVAR